MLPICGRSDSIGRASQTDRMTTMAKLRHIAIATNDPKATAEFYKKAFGFEQIGETSPNSPAPAGWWGSFRRSARSRTPSCRPPPSPWGRWSQSRYVEAWPWSSSCRFETLASAADLKFLHQLQQTRIGTSNRKAALES